MYSDIDIDNLKQKDYLLKRKVLNLKDEEIKSKSPLADEIKMFINEMVDFLSNNLISDQLNEWLNDILFSWKTILLVQFKDYVEIFLPIEYQAPNITDERCNRTEHLYRENFDSIWKDPESLVRETDTRVSDRVRNMASKIEEKRVSGISILNQIRRPNTKLITDVLGGLEQG